MAVSERLRNHVFIAACTLLAACCLQQAYAEGLATATLAAAAAALTASGQGVAVADLITNERSWLQQQQQHKQKQHGLTATPQQDPPAAVQMYRRVLLKTGGQHNSRRVLGATVANQGAFRPMFVLVGDSITEFGFEEDGWGKDMAKTYNRKADILNRGFGGYNSRMGLFILDEFINGFGAGRIKLVTLGFGANDASLPGRKGGALAVPLPEYRANLEAMVKKLRSKGINQIVLLTPPPVVDAIQSQYRSSAHTKTYVDATFEVGKRLKLPVADLYYSMGRRSGWSRNFIRKDGLHLTPAGNKFVGAQVQAAINQNYKWLSSWNMPLHMPRWEFVNAAVPAQTFNPLYGYKVTTGVSLPSNPAPQNPGPAKPNAAPAKPAPAAAAVAPAAKPAPAVAPAAKPAAVVRPKPAAVAVAVAPVKPMGAAVAKKPAGLEAGAGASSPAKPNTAAAGLRTQAAAVAGR